MDLLKIIAARGLSVRQAAEILGVSHSTVARWAQSGESPLTKVQLCAALGPELPENSQARLIAESRIKEGQK